jgi:hypothetical protein
VAAKLHDETGIKPEMVHGAYGEFRVLVDGEPVVESGALGFLGVLPSVTSVIAAVRQRIAR